MSEAAEEKKCPCGAVDEAKPAVSCQSLLWSGWGVLECVLICQQCTWAVANSCEWWQLSDSPCFTKSRSMWMSRFWLHIFFSYTGVIPTSTTLKFWLKPGFYNLILNPLALVSWVCICRNWSVQMTMFKLDHCPLSKVKSYMDGDLSELVTHFRQIGNSRSCNNSQKCCLTSSESLFPSFHEGGTKAILVNYANCCNSYSEAIPFFRKQCELILSAMYKLW